MTSWNLIDFRGVFNPFLPKFLFGPSENLWFSDVFKGTKREHWEEMVRNYMKNLCWHFFFRNLQLKIIRVLNTPLSFQSTENQSKFNETWFRTDKRSIFWQQSEAAIGVALQKKVLLKIWHISRIKHLCCTIFWIKLQAFRSAIF